MDIKSILVLALCFCSIMPYKLFKGNTIPKDYAIGILKYIEYIGSNRLFFTTEEDVLGLMDAKTGALILVYELEDDERIVQHRGSRFIVVQKGRDLNLLLPRNQSYFKLQYSKFLQKQTFKQILSFKRFFKDDYILTDQFLAKAQNPYSINSPVIKTQKQVDKFEIIEKRTDPNQKYLKLINLAEKQPTMVLVSHKKSDTQNSICIIRYQIEGKKAQKVCVAIDPYLKVKNVMQMGPNIQVQTDRINLFFNSKLQIVRQFKNPEMFVFFEQMNRATDPNYLKDEFKMKANSRTAMNFADPSNHKNIDIYQRYILVKKQNSVLATIPKSATDRPIDYWIYSTEYNSMNFALIVQFQNGKVVCFEIDQKAKTYKQLWSLHINPANKEAIGQQRQAKQVNLETQQDLLEKVDKTNDIEINSNSKNNQP